MMERAHLMATAPMMESASMPPSVSFPPPPSSSPQPSALPPSIPRDPSIASPCSHSSPVAHTTKELLVHSTLFPLPLFLAIAPISAKPSHRGDLTDLAGNSVLAGNSLSDAGSLPVTPGIVALYRAIRRDPTWRERHHRLSLGTI